MSHQMTLSAAALKQSLLLAIAGFVLMGSLAVIGTAATHSPAARTAEALIVEP